MEKKTCLQCGKEFRVPKSRLGKYCSQQCCRISKQRQVTFRCAICGKIVNRRLSNFRQNKNHYCSYECSAASRKNKVKRICLFCGKQFWAVPSANRKYCSKKCHDLSMKYKDIRVCEYCGEIFEVNHSRGFSKNQRFCSLKCAGKAKVKRVSLKCLNCGKDFLVKISHSNRRRFCSYRCYHLYKGPSSLEKIMEDALKKFKIVYKSQAMFGDFCVDFFLPKYKSIIECDGQYWHSTLYAKNRDRIKDNLLKSLGYDVYRFSDKEINSSLDDCIKKVIGI